MSVFVVSARVRARVFTCEERRVRHMSARRARVARLAFEGARNPLSKTQIYPEHLSRRAEGLFSDKLLGGTAAPPVAYARRPRHKARGPPRSKKKDLRRNLFLPSYSVAPGAPKRPRGIGVVGRLGEASRRTLDSFGGAAQRTKWLSSSEHAEQLVSFRGEDCVNGALCGAENAPGTQNFGPASKSSPSTSTRTRNDLQPGQPATCQRNPPAQAAPAPPPTSTQRSTGHESP